MASDGGSMAYNQRSVMVNGWKNHGEVMVSDGE